LQDLRSANKPGITVHACDPSYTGGNNSRIRVQASPNKNI
jgi:hypothetical protein